MQANCIVLGISYEYLLTRDIKFYNNCIEGYTTKREIEMNDLQIVGHRVAAKVAQAVWGSKEFSNPIKSFRLRAETRDEKILKTLRLKGLI